MPEVGAIRKKFEGARAVYVGPDPQIHTLVGEPGKKGERPRRMAATGRMVRGRKTRVSPEIARLMMKDPRFEVYDAEGKRMDARAPKEPPPAEE